MEEFSVNDEDLRRAFNPGMRGRRRNRDDATYGIFAGSSDEDDGYNDRRDRGFRSAVGKKSSGSINFIKSAAPKGNNQSQKNLDDEFDSSNSDRDDKITDEEEEETREVREVSIFGNLCNVSKMIDLIFIYNQSN